MLHGIDGRLATRQHYANLLREFQSLLQGPEEPAHQFLKKHPGLLCPTHDRMWSKLPFGDNVSDFVFREPHNDYRASAWAQRRPYPLGKYIPLTDAEWVSCPFHRLPYNFSAHRHKRAEIQGWILPVDKLHNF